MFRKFENNPSSIAVISATIAVFFFSFNDMAIKFLSGGYALHQIVLLRSLIGMAVLLFLFLPFAGGFSALKTKRLGLHIVRGLCVAFANIAFFLGLSALPLAEGVAIFFVSPMLITIFSVIFLGEHVGPRRWAAIGIGFLGVLVVLRPGTEVFQYAALLPIAAAFGYAGLHMLTRYIGRTESTLALSFYIQVTFIAIGLGMGLFFHEGLPLQDPSPAMAFLFHPWEWPNARDWMIIGAVGTSVAFAGFFISQAYRVAEAAVVAPFEYLAMPLAVIWGIVVFDEWPDVIALIGIVMILGAGLFIIWRENAVADAETPDTPRYRR